ncbi:MAG: hypothetical protein ACJ71Z_06265 [Aeromicrobium sp.]
MSKPKRDADEAARRRRAERLLGNLLPEQTSDESGDSWGERADGRDDEIRRDVPPHHGS